MEEKPPAPSQGYQKKIKKNDQPPPKPKRDPANPVDYSSPAAKKLPLFFDAIKGGDVEAVKKFIDEGINVNVARDGVTPLMIAASRGHIEIAQAILEAGVNINERNDDDWTALHKAAVEQAGAGIVDLLVESGIDLEAKNKSGKTALQLAEETKHRDIVRAIKKRQDQLGLDATEWEAFLKSPEGKPFKQSRRFDSLALLFKFWWAPLLALGVCGLLLGFLIHALLPAAIGGTAAGGAISLSLWLREKTLRAYLDKIGPLPHLDIHILREKRSSGEPLLAEVKKDAVFSEPAAGDEPADIGLIHDTTLSLGPIEEDGRIVKRAWKEDGLPRSVAYAVLGALLFFLAGILYVTHKDSIDKWYFAKKLEKIQIPFSEQSFLSEVAKNNEMALDLFIKAGINVAAKNEKGQTALIIASEKGYVNTLGRLAGQYPSLLNDADKSGYTALMTAARRGQENSIKVLIENGVDVNYMVPSKEGPASALQAALDASDFKEEHMRAVQYLLQHGANVKGRNKAGQFPLLFAGKHGRAEAAKLLIEQGADVNETDVKGNFPLMIAACGGHSGLVALLAEKGANIKAALPGGQTPLMCAALEGHENTVKALLERGADVNTRSAAGSTALTDAAGSGRVEVVKVLLAQGADPAYAAVPEAFVNLKGRTVRILGKKNKLGDMLKRIAQAASQDGYTITVDSTLEQKTTAPAGASWNKVLRELATKNHLVLVVKEKEVFVLPYNPAGVKHSAV